MMLHLLSFSKCIHLSYTYKALPTISNAYFRFMSVKGTKDGHPPKPPGSECKTQNEPPKTPIGKKEEPKLVDSVCKKPIEVTASCKKDGDKPKPNKEAKESKLKVFATKCIKDEKPKDCKKPVEAKASCKKDEKPKDCKKPVEAKASCKKDEKPKDCKKPVEAKPSCKKEEKPKDCKKPVEAKASCKKEEKPKDCKKPVEAKASCKKEEKPKDCKKPVEVKASCKKEEKPKECKKPGKAENKCKLLKKPSCAHQSGQKKKCPSGGDHHSASTWKKISLFGCIPLIVLLTGIVFGTHHEAKRAEFKKWEHMYRRTKPFFFGGGPGNKSYYHNPHVNPLPPLGYEDEIDIEADGQPEETLLEKAERYVQFELLRREWKKKDESRGKHAEQVKMRPEMKEKATEMELEEKNKKKAEDVRLKDMKVKSKEMEYVPLEEDEEHDPTK